VKFKADLRFDWFLPQHGAAWAKLCKDSIFQGRKSIELRDRFRNVSSPFAASALAIDRKEERELTEDAFFLPRSSPSSTRKLDSNLVSPEPRPLPYPTPLMNQDPSPISVQVLRLPQLRLRRDGAPRLLMDSRQDLPRDLQPLPPHPSLFLVLPQVAR